MKKTCSLCSLVVCLAVAGQQARADDPAGTLTSGNPPRRSQIIPMVPQPDYCPPGMPGGYQVMPPATMPMPSTTTPSVTPAPSTTTPPSSTPPSSTMPSPSTTGADATAAPSPDRQPGVRAGHAGRHGRILEFQPDHVRRSLPG